MANISERKIMVPGDPGFHDILISPPPGWQSAKRAELTTHLVADSETGLLRPASPAELQEYVWGGEYEERLNYLEANGLVENDDNWE